MKNLKNLHYNLEFEPDFSTFTFRAKETLSFESEEETDKLTLNSAELKLSSLHIESGGRKYTPKFTLNEEDEEITLFLEKKAKGKITISFEFTGNHNDQLIGFYRSKYSLKGKEKFLVTTQFEAADARRAFVCFDEPDAKATFDIAIIAENSLKAISNMPEIKSENLGKKTRHVFGTTPKMSTYLAYMAVGDFEYIEDNSKKVNIKVYTTPGKKEHGRFALEIGRKFLEYYEKYFRIPYPLPKMDLIAIPDFAAGAMENWGAITFRENALLFDPKFSTAATKQRVAEVVAHEIAHQWFGNLVTMKWWNDLWLNESFATFMAAKAVDRIFPEFEFWSEFIADSTEAALSLDSMNSSHPIEASVKTPKEISEIFDSISYDKGGNILRMLEDFLGEKMFVEGVKLYLEKHKYSNTESVDLWSAWEEVSKKPVIEMLSGWVKKQGYPLVSATGKNKKITLSQERFLLEENKKDDTLWLIPVTVSSGKKESRLIMESKTTEFLSDGAYKLNSGQMGFYRARYDDAHLDILKNEISRLGNADRWGLQNDFFALCQAGKEPVKKYFGLLCSYENETDYLVMSDILGNLYYLHMLGFNEKFSAELKKESLKFLWKSFNTLGWEPLKNEKHNLSLLRSKTLSMLVKTDDAKTIARCNSLFEKYLGNKDSVMPDIQLPVFSGAAWQGGSKTFEKFTGLYHDAETYEEKIRFLAALACFKDKKMLERTFRFMLSDKIRYSDIIYPVSYLASNPHAKDMLWPWVKKNWKGLNEKLGETKSLLRRIVLSLKVLSGKEAEKDIKAFFEKNPGKGIDMALSQALEGIRINTRLLQNMRKEF